MTDPCIFSSPALYYEHILKTVGGAKRDPAKRDSNAQ